MNSNLCFSREQLRNYLAGELPEPQLDLVSAHLAACVDCEVTVAELDGQDDTFIETLRRQKAAHSSVETDEPSAFRLAAKRLQAVPPDELALGDAAATEQPVATLTTASSPLLVRDYELLEPLGRGGMGTVYKALHRRLQRRVAVKILPTRWLANQHTIARFQREMQAVGQLQHPAIVQATDGGEVDQVYYLVMELVDGVDLKSLVERLGPLEPEAACELARQAAVGLAHAHERGIIHRDVKPSNLMLAKTGQVKILDLGLARIVGEQLADDLTTVGQLMGTVDYMAPEQFENSHTVDERADVYGLGAMLFKLLTGRAPYAGVKDESPLAKLRRIAMEPPPHVAALRTDLPMDLAEFVDRLLSRQPEDRPSSMPVVAEALATWACPKTLPGLVEKARIVPDSSSPSLSLPTSLTGSKIMQPVDEVIAAPVPSQPPRRRSNWLSLTATLLMLFGLVAAGIIITLQTSAGQLVIETTTPDVEVRILKAGQPHRELKLTQQAESVRLGAGEYEIELTSPADGLEVADGKFTLKRGDTWVARITKTGNPTPATIAAAPAIPLTDTTLRFEGKTFEEWFHVLKTERKPDTYCQALDVVKRLCPPEKNRETVQAIIESAVEFDRHDVATIPKGSAVWRVAHFALMKYPVNDVLAVLQQLLENDSKFVDLTFEILEVEHPHYGQQQNLLRADPIVLQSFSDVVASQAVNASSRKEALLGLCFLGAKVRDATKLATAFDTLIRTSTTQDRLDLLSVQPIQMPLLRSDQLLNEERINSILSHVLAVGTLDEQFGAIVIIRTHSLQQTMLVTLKQLVQKGDSRESLIASSAAEAISWLGEDSLPFLEAEWKRVAMKPSPSRYDDHFILTLAQAIQRITDEPSVEAVAKRLNPSSQPILEPLFNNRPFSQWFHQLTTERNPKSALEAMEAVARLCPEGMETEVVLAIIRTAAVFSSNEVLSLPDVKNDQHIWSHVGFFLRQLPVAHQLAAVKVVFSEKELRVKAAACELVLGKLPVRQDGTQTWKSDPHHDDLVNSVCALTKSDNSELRSIALKTMVSLHQIELDNAPLKETLFSILTGDDFDAALKVLQGPSETTPADDLKQEVEVLRRVLRKGNEKQQEIALKSLHRYESFAAVAVPDVVDFLKEQQRSRSLEELASDKKHRRFVMGLNCLQALFVNTIAAKPYLVEVRDQLTAEYEKTKSREVQTLRNSVANTIAVSQFQ